MKLSNSSTLTVKENSDFSIKKSPCVFFIHWLRCLITQNVPLVMRNSWSNDIALISRSRCSFTWMSEWLSFRCVPWKWNPPYFGCGFVPISRHWRLKSFSNSIAAVAELVHDGSVRHVFPKWNTFIKNRSPLFRPSPVREPIIFWGVISLLQRGDFIWISNWAGGLLLNISVIWARLLLSSGNRLSLFCQDKCKLTHFQWPNSKQLL